MGTPFGQPDLGARASLLASRSSLSRRSPYGDDNDAISARSVPLSGEGGQPAAPHASRAAPGASSIVPCFTPEVRLATQRGLVRAADLVCGDRLVTRDNGLQEIRWIGEKSFRGPDLVSSPNLQPVLICAGALGDGLPERDMLVSPNHRVLVSSDHLLDLTGEREGLVAAKLLVGRPGIHRIAPTMLTYVHFMFDRHEVVLSDGAWTESFQPGDYSLRGIDAAQREELFAIFPELRQARKLESYIAARPSLRAVDATILNLR